MEPLSAIESTKNALYHFQKNSIKKKTTGAPEGLDNWSGPCRGTSLMPGFHMVLYLLGTCCESCILVVWKSFHKSTTIPGRQCCNNCGPVVEIYNI